MKSPQQKRSEGSAHVSTRPPLSRRQFLRGAGIALSLPLLESMRPAFGRTASVETSQRQILRPKRMLAICNNLGVLPEHFFPQGEGKGYSLSSYLNQIAAHRSDFTVFSGVSHPGVDGGHASDICFLTAAPHPGGTRFRNTISLDQYIGQRVGHLTRFPTLTLGVNVQQGVRSLSWTDAGTLIPCEEKPSDVFRRLFVQGSSAEVAAQVRKLSLGCSILDVVADQAKYLAGKIGRRDRERLDQYLTGVRELEQRMHASRQWETQPKPVVDVPVPLDLQDPRDYMGKTKMMYDLARLAFETDSTRSISLMLDSVNSPAIELGETRITDGYHNLSHHGKSKIKMAQLQAIDEWHMRLLGDLFTELKGIEEEDRTLMDQTMILYGSNLGNANTHENTNLPLLLAGGGFRHGQHLAFDPKRNYPMANVFVSMLQQFGVETDAFASGSSSCRGLEPV